MPAILLGQPRVSFNGRAAGAQTVARINMVLHLWADASDAENAQSIGGAVLAALMDAPQAEDVWVGGQDRRSLAWAPDPGGTHIHGPVRLSCVAVAAMRTGKLQHQVALQRLVETVSASGHVTFP